MREHIISSSPSLPTHVRIAAHSLTTSSPGCHGNRVCEPHTHTHTRATTHSPTTHCQPLKFVLSVVKGVRSNELEESLLVLPFDYVGDLLKLLDQWLKVGGQSQLTHHLVEHLLLLLIFQEGFEVELCCCCLFLLLRCSHVLLSFMLCVSTSTPVNKVCVCGWLFLQGTPSPGCVQSTTADRARLTEISHSHSS